MCWKKIIVRTPEDEALDLDLAVAPHLRFGIVFFYFISFVHLPQFLIKSRSSKNMYSYSNRLLQK